MCLEIAYVEIHSKFNIPKIPSDLQFEMDGLVLSFFLVKILKLFDFESCIYVGMEIVPRTLSCLTDCIDLSRLFKLPFILVFSYVLLFHDFN